MSKKLKKKSVSIDSTESDVQDAEIQKAKNDKPKIVKKIKKKTVVAEVPEKIKGVDKEEVESSSENKIEASVYAEKVNEAENIDCEKNDADQERKLSSKSSKSDDVEEVLSDQIQNLKMRKKSLKSEIKDLDIQMAMSLPTEALKTAKKKAEVEMNSIESEMQDVEAQLEENENIKRAEEIAKAEAMAEDTEAPQQNDYSKNDIVEDLPKTERESEQSENANDEDDDSRIVISENNGTVAFNKSGSRKNSGTEKATMM